MPEPGSASSARKSLVIHVIDVYKRQPPTQYISYTSQKDVYDAMFKLLDEEEIPVLTKALDNLYQFFKTYNG